MSGSEVLTPIVNSPFFEPLKHWIFSEGQPAHLQDGRRAAGYHKTETDALGQIVPVWHELTLANRIRARLAEWRETDYAGATGVSRVLLKHWRDEGREQKLFFAQLEAVEAIIFLHEARADLLQGISVPMELDKPFEDGYKGFVRYALKMATGSGKTTVMAMLAAWTILNKAESRKESKYSDTVLIVCPNVTIRERLQELKPGAGSLYYKRDLVPPGLMPKLQAGKVAVTNWHSFERKTLQEGGTSAAVVKRGVREEYSELLHFGARNETVRGKRVTTWDTFQQMLKAGLLEPTEEVKIDKKTGMPISVRVKRVRYVETEQAAAKRVLRELELSGRRNILVLNDEAHHAYRVQQTVAPVPGDEDELEDVQLEQERATVWVSGLDRIARYATAGKEIDGINFAVDLSATPFYLMSVGDMAQRPFRWIISDFGLVDSIESGLVKVPQLPAADATGSERASYYNLWDWVVRQLDPGERGGAKGEAKPEAVLRIAAKAIEIAAADWHREYLRWEAERGIDDKRRPVIIIVCKNTKLAKLLYEWIAQDQPPTGMGAFTQELLRNIDGQENTIRVDSKVIQEDPEAESKDSSQKWMRFTLDTVGRRDWPKDQQKNPVYPEGFVELAGKLGKGLEPPGRNVRCVISVGMLTEGWDCQTVTTIIGLRPFTSQLLCEQVVGRGLRRVDYELTENGMFNEEVAEIIGVPFSVVPFKASGQPRPPQKPRTHVYALPEREHLRIEFPRVEGYYSVFKRGVTVDWGKVPQLIVSESIPTVVLTKMQVPGNSGRAALHGPGKISKLDLEETRKKLRLQRIVFQIAAQICKDMVAHNEESPDKRVMEIPKHELLRQMLAIVQRFVDEHLIAHAPSERVDLHFAPYFGYASEIIRESLRPVDEDGVITEYPIYEKLRGPGSTSDVDFFTPKQTRAAERSHINLQVFDTERWEQATAFAIDNHPVTGAFVRNERLGFVIPYTDNYKRKNFTPDFIVRAAEYPDHYLILEPKGYDMLLEKKQQAALRWCAAVNAEGSFGTWHFALLTNEKEAEACLTRFEQLLRTDPQQVEVKW
ncbi:DEAD/DEAH box helicase family protein [bacterium]|nr:DEAD/DEAH box helicase family protein [bacterium]